MVSVLSPETPGEPQADMLSGLGGFWGPPPKIQWIMETGHIEDALSGDMGQRHRTAGEIRPTSVLCHRVLRSPGRERIGPSWWPVSGVFGPPRGFPM